MAEPNTIYQYSLLSALMAGVCEEGITASKLSSKGNQGIGTFARMNGELILLDGKVYQLTPNGPPREASANDQIPFAMAVNFVPTHTKTNFTISNKNSLNEVLEEILPQTNNVFISYRIEARFSSITVRMVRGQEYKGQPLSELGENQSVQTYTDIDGIIVGFRSPQPWQGFSVAGKHLHFISLDRGRGGHVLEMVASDAKLSAAVASNVHVELPTSAEFNTTNLVVDDAGIRKVEG
ncbi:alpha-acetolactate decarboxylase [Polytolypa hystricis UAMH7299]|uniref:Alpha-acetolactate decarboxylase n=1 Tax=Polytolypa hystricis (strain UAMH7299) TaxID=1447883 RepID=A0A2B7XVP9_POLH7|nr:alpha-acetolactate decarboxylase [Polytolypa hystricis UAMH7299]